MDNNDKIISVEWFDQGIQHRLESYENMLIGQIKLQCFNPGMFRHDDSILDLHLGYLHALRELGCINGKEMRDRLESFRKRVETELDYMDTLKAQADLDEEDDEDPFEEY